MTPEDLNFIRMNVPDEISDEQIKQVFQNTQENLLETLSYFLKIEQKEEKKKTEWEERRDICDAYDAEMQKMIKKK
jgi:hypothetical protein